MDRKADWKATLEEILAERRQRFGEPPSEGDWIALRAGELSGDDRQRLLEHASVDPEVARELFDILRFPEPSGDQEPDADEDGVARRWKALRHRLAAEGDLPAEGTAPPVSMPRIPQPSRPAWLPLAAMFALGVAGTLVVGSLRDPGDLGAGRPVPTAEPRINLPIVELLPVGEDTAAARGSAERITVAADAGGLVLALAVPDLAPGRGPFTLELTRGDGTTATLDGLTPGIGGVFVLDLPRAHWTEGRHALRLRDAGGESVALFQLEVALRR